MRPRDAWEAGIRAIVRDAAHNPESAAVLAAELPAIIGQATPTIGVLAILADKEVDGVITALAARLDGVVATASSSDRALPAERLAAHARALGLESEAVADPARALVLACERAGRGGAVVITGSLTLLAALGAE
jgi:dihydrofolate synthase/folylpolyglutamate synthase